MKKFIDILKKNKFFLKKKKKQKFIKSLITNYKIKKKTQKDFNYINFNKNTNIYFINLIPIIITKKKITKLKLILKKKLILKYYYFNYIFKKSEKTDFVRMGSGKGSKFTTYFLFKKNMIFLKLNLIYNFYSFFKIINYIKAIIQKCNFKIIIK